MPELESLVPKQLSAFSEICCALSTRRGGVSPEPLGLNLSYNVGDAPANVEENRKRFFGSLQIPPDRLAIPRQCHSSTIKRADAPGSFDATDGLITEKKNVWLVVSVADCTPVFIFDPSKSIVAALHAGWRGSAAGIAGLGIQVMAREFGSKPSDLRVFIGPSAGGCCYRVGPEVAELFDGEVLTKREGSIFLDLKKENRRQLLAAGVPEDQIETSEYCTIHHEQFHSYRRDRERSGRMMGVIGLRG